MSLAGSPRCSSPYMSNFPRTPTHDVSADELLSDGPYGHGSFQWRILFFAVASLGALICQSQLFTLISGPVDHWCKPPPEFSDLSVATWKNVGIPLDKEGRYSQCYAYVHPKVANDSDPGEIFACAAWDYDQGRARQSARSFWNMVCHRRWMKVLADAVYMSGALVLVPLAGYVADISGRLPVITAAVMVGLFTALGSCCADTYVIYMATRFISSGSASSIFLIASMLFYEVTAFKYQASHIVLMFFIAFVCADVFVMFMVQLHMTWFWLQTALVSPTALLLSVFCVIYESPLWLINMSRFRRAEEVIKRAAKINDVKLETVQQAVLRLRTELKRREGSISVITPAGVASARELRERAAIIFVVTFAVMLAFYRTMWAVLEHLDPEVSKVTDLCVGIPIYMALYIAANIAGTKQILLFMLPLLGGLCSMCGVAVYARPWYVSCVLMIVAKQCSVVTMPVMYIFTAELFPTGARCAVLCAAYACGRLGAIVASSLRLLTEYRFDDVSFAIVGSVVLGSAVLVLRLPETRVGRQEGPNTEQSRDPLFLLQKSLKVKLRGGGQRSPRRARKFRT